MVEMRMFIVLLLSQVTIELDPKSDSCAQLDTARVGTGVCHAKGDFNVIVRRKL
jgi:hypothetical protein